MTPQTMNTMQQIGDLIGRKFALIGTADEVETEEEDNGYKEVIVDGVRFYEIDTKPIYDFATDRQQVKLSSASYQSLDLCSFSTRFRYLKGAYDSISTINGSRSMTIQYGVAGALTYAFVDYYFTYTADKTAVIPILQVIHATELTGSYYISEVAPLFIAEFPSDLVSRIKENCIRNDRPCLV